MLLMGIVGDKIFKDEDKGLLYKLIMIINLFITLPLLKFENLSIINLIMS